MLKVNAGLSRKLTQDYNSTGFTINLESEICADRNDTEVVVERIQEIYDLAEEALLRQIERYQSDTALASHDAPPPAPENQRTESNGSSKSKAKPKNRISDEEPATNKQIQFLLTLGKRMKLTKPKLEKRVAEILGQSVDIYDISKRDCGIVLDTLTEKQDAKN